MEEIVKISDEYTLHVSKDLTSLLSEEMIHEYLREVVEYYHGSPPDAIVLHSLESKRGNMLNDRIGQFVLFEGGEHYNIKAALVRKGIEMKDLRGYNRLTVYSLYPRLYFDPTNDPTAVGKSESIKSKLSMFWFIINLIFCILVIYVIGTNFPRNRYYHVENKRAVVEPYYRGW